MSGDDSVGHKGDAGAIVTPMPLAASRKCSQQQCAVYFGISEGFVVAVAPAQTAKNAHLRSNVLFKIEAETIFVASLVPRENNVGRGSFTVLEISDSFFIVPHVRVIQIAKEAHHAGSVGQNAAA